MKFPISMLRDYVQTSLNAEEVGDLLTMAGFELEGIESVEGDDVLDIKVVSNRGDGLSVFGLAREVLAKDGQSKPTDLYGQAQSGWFGEGLESVPATADSAQPASSFSIPATAATVDSPECLRFACRAFDNVDATAQSPEWMQKRLAQAGMRPISILVDLTNYVMLELGQPLHAFDRDKLTEQRIVVRKAKPGEKLTTLNGLEHELNGQMMICDAEKPVGVPGVMGGLETEVTDDTTRLLLESANFKNTTVRKTRKQLALNTEASYRFERSVDPEGVVRAIERFSRLLVQSLPLVAASNIVDLYPGKQTREPIRLRLERANRLLGMEIDKEDAIRYLRNLGFDPQPHDSEFRVTPPSWRPDIVREEDLIEELGRVHGYEKIPSELPIGHTPVGGTHGQLYKIDLIRDALVRAGFIQIISHSLRDKHPLDNEGGHVGPKNPASPEMSVLRNSLLPCLADAAVRNGGKDLHLFEIGAAFFPRKEKTKESKLLAILSVGALQPFSWQKGDAGQANFYSLKGALENALSQAGVEFEIEASTEPDPRLHPTRDAYIKVGGQLVGFVAQIHPNVAEQLGLPAETYLAELGVSALDHESDIAYRPISRNPAVRRDISFEISKSQPFSSIEKTLTEACGDVLEKHWLFDVYEGKGIGEGNHSLSVALQLRKHGENFTDEEANQVREKAVAALSALGAKSR